MSSTEHWEKFSNLDYYSTWTWRSFFLPDHVGCLEGLSERPEELIVAHFVLKQCLFSAARWRTHSCRLFNLYWRWKWQFCNSDVPYYQRSVNLSSWLVIVGGTSVRYARRDFSLGSSVFSSSPELTFLHCTLHLSSPSFREHSLTFCYGCIAVLGDELLYFAVPWCTVVHCYCPMMYCIEVLSNIVFWCIASHCIVGWRIAFNIAL